MSNNLQFVPFSFSKFNEENIKNSLSPAGFEPATFGLEVQRAIHCATGTGCT